MGEVYEAEHLETGRRLALKVLSRGLSDSTDRSRFLREGRLAASINHPNCVYVYGTEEIGETPVISMEFVPAGTLKDRIAEKGPMSPTKAVDAILQVIDGLEAAAAVGVLHRDIKPSNCFLDRDGTVKIGDFGLSISTLSRAESHLTATGTFLGTPAFASPEQLRCEDVDVRSDIYSVGATLYSLLTGRAPFEEEKMGRLIAAVLERAPAPVRRLAPSIPRGLERVVLRCLQKDPAQRVPTYAALRIELGAYCSAAPTPATLGLRFGAGAIDDVLLSLGFMTVTVVGQGFDALANSEVSLWPQLLFHAAKILYFTVAEGLWGASLGKAVCGLRVVGVGRAVPGLRRAFVRAFVWLTVPFLPLFVYLVSRGGATLSGKDAVVRLLALFHFALMILLFATARRANGYAGVHDLASGTRVILKSLQLVRPGLTVRMETVPAGEGPTRVGPYSILRTLREGATEKLLAGHDDRLRRRTWIEILPVDSPALSAVRRDLGRPGRLRWLNGKRTDAACWDAYEAPEGRALESLSAGSQPWVSVRHWLLDLAEELEAGLKDGSSPTVLALDRIWITLDGRAKLLDFPAPTGQDRADPSTGTARGSEYVSAQTFLDAVARAALKQPVPLHARLFLDELQRESFPNLSALVTELKSLISRPAAVSRRRRLGQLALSATFPLVVMAGLVCSALLDSKWASEHEKLGSFFMTLNELRKNQVWERFEGVMRERRDLQLLAASQYRELRSDPALWTNRLATGMNGARLRRIADQAAARFPIFSVEEVADAEAELKPLLESARREAVRERWMMPLVCAPFLFLVAAVFGLVSALLVRGGLHFRLAGTAIVTRDGSEASRLRSLSRAIVAWSPWLLLPLGVLLAKKSLRETQWELIGKTLFREGGVKITPPTLILGAALLFLAGALWAALRPQRGLQDRIAGTYLVPR